MCIVIVHMVSRPVTNRVTRHESPGIMELLCIRTCFQSDSDVQKYTPYIYPKLVENNFHFKIQYEFVRVNNKSIKFLVFNRHQIDMFQTPFELGLLEIG